MSSFLSCARCIINPALSMNFKQRAKCFHVRGWRRRNGRKRRRRWWGGLVEKLLLSSLASFDKKGFGLWPVWKQSATKFKGNTLTSGNQEAGVAHFLFDSRGCCCLAEALTPSASCSDWL